MIFENIWNSNQIHIHFYTATEVQIHDSHRDSFLNVAAIASDVVLHF